MHNLITDKRNMYLANCLTKENKLNLFKKYQLMASYDETFLIRKGSWLNCQQLEVNNKSEILTQLKYFTILCQRADGPSLYNN